MTTIYVTDECPFQSAANLDDPTVATQIMYVSRILATVAELEHKAIFLTDVLNKDDPYVRWCRNMCKNRDWMLGYSYGLLAEYEDRNECEHHFTKAMNALIVQYQYMKPKNVEFLNRSKFHLYLKNPIEAYRAELKDLWNKRYRNDPLRWRRRTPPEWYPLPDDNECPFDITPDRICT